MINEIVALSKELISIQSVEKNTAGLQEILDLTSAEVAGFTVEHFESNGVPSLLIYNVDKRPERFKVILNAHLDVVPGKDKQFRPYVEDGKLIGRGAYDMKAAAAAEIVLFKELARNLGYPLGLQLVTDEETGGYNGTDYQIKHGVRSDFTVAGEPTEMMINHKAKGFVRLKIKTSGKPSHGAYLWRGDNAIVKMVDVLEKLYTLYPIPSEEVWETTVNVASMNTPNQTINVVPDKCEVALDIRYPNGNAIDIVHSIKNILPGNTEVVVLGTEPIQFTDENNSYIQSFGKSVESVLGTPSKLVLKHGGSDIRHYTELGDAGITFGPSGGEHHTDKEWVEVESLEKFYLILNDFLLNLK